MEVVDPARQPAVTDPDLGLDRARPVDDADEPADRRARVDDRRGSGSVRVRRRASTIRSRRSASADHVLAAEVAADDERRPARVERPAVDRAELGAAESLDRLARPAGRPVVGRLPARRSCRRTPPRRGAAGRPGPGAGRSGARRAAARPRIRGTSAGGGPRRRARAPVPGGRPARRRRRVNGVPAGLGVERGPEPLRRPRPGRSRRSARCPRSARGRPGRSPRPASAGSSTAPPVTTIEADTSGRPGQVDDEDGQAVRQAAAGDGRELVGARRAGRAAARRRPDRPASDRRSCSCRHLLVGRRPRRLGVLGRERHVVLGRALGQVGQDHPVVRPEDGGRDVADRLGVTAR